MAATLDDLITNINDLINSMGQNTSNQNSSMQQLLREMRNLNNNISNMGRGGNNGGRNNNNNNQNNNNQNNNNNNNNNNNRNRNRNRNWNRRNNRYNRQQAAERRHENAMSQLPGGRSYAQGRRMQRQGNELIREGSRMMSNGQSGGSFVKGYGNILSKMGKFKAHPAMMIADMVGGAVKAVGDFVAKYKQYQAELANIDNKIQLENIQYQFDTLFKDIQTNAKIATTSIELNNKELLNSTKLAFDVVGGDIQANAYEAANMQLSLAGEAAMGQLDIAIAEQDRAMYNRERKQENLNKISELQAERSLAETKYTSSATTGILESLPLVGDAIGGISSGVSSMIVAEKELQNVKLRNENEIKMAWVKGANEGVREFTNAARALAEKDIERMTQLTAEQLKFAQRTEQQATKFDVAATRLGKNLGIVLPKQLDGFKKSLLDSNVSLSKWNKTIEEFLALQTAYIDTTSRVITFSDVDTDKILALGDLLGDDNLAVQLNAAMNPFNQSVENSVDMFTEMYNQVRKIGLSTQKYSKDLLKNLKLAERYQFKGGVKNLMEMAIWADKMRFNMDSLDSMLSKVHEGGLEGIITQSAQLQVLGGAAAMGSDPLAMLWESYNDPASYAQRMQNMTSDMGIFDEKTGQTYFNAADQMRIEAMAKAQGRSAEDLFGEIRERNKRENISKILNGKGLNQDQIDNIASKAQWRDGQWQLVSMDGKTTESLDKINSNTDLSLFQSNDTIKDIAETLYAIRDNQTQSESESKREMAVMVKEVFQDAMNEQLKRIENVANNFKEEYKTLRDAAISGMELATNSQATVLSKFVEEQDKAVEAMNQAASAMSNLNTTLSEIYNKGQEAVKNLDENKKQVEENLTKSDNPENPVEPVKKKYDNVFVEWWDDIKSLFVGDGFVSGNGILTSATKVTPIHDGLVSGDKSSPMVTSATKVTPIHDGLVAKTDPKDVGFYAKPKGPFDKLLDDVLGGMFGLSDFIEKATNDENSSDVVNIDYQSQYGVPQQSQIISTDKLFSNLNDTLSECLSSNLYSDIETPLNSTFNEVISRMENSIKQLQNEINTVYPIDGRVEPEIMVLPSKPETSPEILDPASYLNTPATHNSSTSNDGKLSFEAPLKIEMSGTLKLESNGQSIDIMKEIQNNPLLLRNLTQMISESISRNMSGGKVVYNGGQLVGGLGFSS